MSKSNKYGYSGVDIPTQAFKSNVGKFDPSEINELVDNNQWTQFGQLELLQTNTVSNAVCDFTSLQETTYKVHFITISDVHIGSQTEFGYRLSNDSGSSFETGYHFASQRGIADGSFQERRSEGQDSARLCGDIDEDSHSLANGFMYMYSAGDSSNYTYTTSHMTFIDFQDLTAVEFGSQLYDHKEQISGIRFGAGTGVTALTSATISLYGIRNF